MPTNGRITPPQPGQPAPDFTLPVENARMYFRFRPSKVLLAADAELGTHRPFGLPKCQRRRSSRTRLRWSGVTPRARCTSR